MRGTGKKISVEFEKNPLKVKGSKNYVPWIQQMLEGFEKDNPAKQKKLPVEVDIPNYLAEVGRDTEASELAKAMGDLTLQWSASSCPTQILLVPPLLTPACSKSLFHLCSITGQC